MKIKNDKILSGWFSSSVFWINATIDLIVPVEKLLTETCLNTYGNHINFRPIHFSSYGNLKVIFETTFRHLSFSSFILTSSIHLYISIYLNISKYISKYLYISIYLNIYLYTLYIYICICICIKQETRHT